MVVLEFESVECELLEILFFEFLLGRTTHEMDIKCLVDVGFEIPLSPFTNRLRIQFIDVFFFRDDLLHLIFNQITVYSTMDL